MGNGAGSAAMETGVMLLRFHHLFPRHICQLGLVINTPDIHPL